jgi:hypothetical protein
MNKKSLCRFVAVTCVPCFCLLLFSPPGWAQPLPLSIRVHTESGAAISTAKIQLEQDGKVSTTALTDAEGKASIGGLTLGQYNILVTAETYEQAVQLVLIRDERQEIEVDFTLLPKLRRTDTIDVVADAGTVETANAIPVAAEIRTEETTLLPSRPATVTDTLPLVPGVNRSPNGEILINGQGEQQNSLLVNANNAADPGTGRFGTTIPADSVESVQVLKTPFLPQYGGFTAGVVSVETKRGGDKWHFSVKEPLPDFRVRSHRLHGLRNATPRISFDGPVIKNKLFLSEAVQYKLEKKQARTLPFPFNESKDESVNSYSQIDYIVSPSHFITASAHVAPGHINFVDPQFFNPQPVTPNLRAQELMFTLTDHATVLHGLLDSSINHQTFNVRVGAQGNAEMVLTPIGNTGNYFARRQRNSSRIEWLETLSLNKGSRHALKVGTIVARAENRGSFSFEPVEIRDSNQQLLERIDFEGGDPFRQSDLETGFFAQDHWTLRPNLSLDGGARVEHQHRTSSLRVAPRIAASWTPFGERQLVVRGGFGVFYDRVPLTAYSFDRFPQQVVTNYDPTGGTAPSTTRFLNAIDIDETQFPLVRRTSVPGNFAPYSRTWTAEAERTVARLVHIRVNYQRSSSGDQILLSPQMSGNDRVLLLQGGGRSIYHQFEVTARLAWKGGQQMMFSYVRSKAEGDLNTFSSYLGDFPIAKLRPNLYSNLRSDIPNRFLVWGLINLPWKMRLAPIFEYRSGLPYAILEAHRNYVGIPYSNRTRFRDYVGLDERISKEIPLMRKYRARISVSMLNALNHFNPLDVHANTADPQFGTFFGHYKRRYRLDFELLF